jgi:hypothetical protein
MFVFDKKTGRWVPLRQTAEYKKRKKILRDAWIFICAIMLALPVPAIFILGLLSTFLSFTFLDESTYGFQIHNDDYPGF